MRKLLGNAGAGRTACNIVIVHRYDPDTSSECVLRGVCFFGGANSVASKVSLLDGREQTAEVEDDDRPDDQGYADNQKFLGF